MENTQRLGKVIIKVTGTGVSHFLSLSLSFSRRRLLLPWPSSSRSQPLSAVVGLLAVFSGRRPFRRLSRQPPLTRPSPTQVLITCPIFYPLLWYFDSTWNCFSFWIGSSLLALIEQWLLIFLFLF